MSRFPQHPGRLLLASLFLLLLAAGWLVAPRLASGGGVIPTNAWVDIFSRNSVYNGQPLPVGAVVAAYDPQGVKCGEFTVRTAGKFGIMACYGDDATTPGDEGAVSGDILHFTINGDAAQVTAVALNGVAVAPDTPITWNQHGDRWEINLSWSSTPTATPTPTLTPTPQKVWRFWGHAYRGQPGERGTPLPGVMLHLYGRSQGDPAPGRWIKTVASDGSGYFSFYIIEPYIYEIMRLVADPPEGLAATGAQSADGDVISLTEVEWRHPAAVIHRSQFFFDVPTPTPTATVTPSPTFTATPTATATPTSTPTLTPVPTPMRCFLPVLLHP